MTTTPSNMPENRREMFVVHFARDQRRIHAFIGAMLPNVADAEEVMQETSLIMWRKWSEYREGSDFASWACGIARLEVFKFCRQKRRNTGIVLSDEILELVALEHQRQLDRSDKRTAAMLACIEELSKEQYELFVQRYSQKITTRALAEQLGRPPSTIYKAIDRTRSQLRDCIERRLAAEERG